MKKKIIAMIPARIGSKRLKKKNLILINNKPLINYVIDEAKKSNIFYKIVLNADHKIFKKIADKNKIQFYLRPKKLGSSKTRSDDVVYDFINKFNSDICVWVNPIAPLQTSSEIRKVIKFFITKKLNSLITVLNKKVHTIFDKKPINFTLKGKFELTQNLKPISEMVYSIMMWNSNSFNKSMKLYGHALMHKKIGFYPVSKSSSIIVKTIEDVKLINQIINLRKKKNFKFKYFK